MGKLDGIYKLFIHKYHSVFDVFSSSFYFSELSSMEHLERCGQQPF